MFIRKNGKNLFKFLLVFVVLVIVSGISLYFLNKSKVVKDMVDVPSKIVTKEDTKKCVKSDQIEYLYYDETPVLWEKNNKFGLYVYAENKDFFELAQNLVNSNGGDWGYVLIPYNVKDRDVDKWTRVFDQLKQKHLIPVVQLWDIDTDKYKEQTSDAAVFLNKFVWPIRYRYISSYNEPNSAAFWYGKVDPEGYAKILKYTVESFKSENKDFFVMNGALNMSAPTNASHVDSLQYMYQMNKAVPGIFEKLDGWASHPYPQPNFSGSPYDTGRWSIKGYDEELNYLKNTLKVSKELPVFITETGWAHEEGANFNYSYYSVDKVSEFFKVAFEEVWLKDARVRAVMPFTVRYDPPHDHFSWVNSDNVPYKHYDAVKELKKVKGKPPVLNSASIVVNKCE